MTTGWEAQLRLRFAERNGKTILVENQHKGPLTVQRPLYPEGQVCHTYILHPPGGVVGGDKLHLDIEVKPGAAALVTTPGATKFYRSGGRLAMQEQQLQANGSSLEWFPQDSIIHPGAECSLATRIELDRQARFIGWEILSLGLPAQQQPFNPGRLESCLALSREGRPLLLDRLRVEGPGELDGPAGLRSFPVSAIFLATNAKKSLVEEIRSILPDDPRHLAGVTLMGELLVVRYLGYSTFHARDVFTRVWATLRPALLNRRPCLPRIWAT